MNRIAPPSLWSAVRNDVMTFAMGAGWIAASLSLVPLRPWAEGPVARVLAFVLGMKRGGSHYEYEPWHYPCFVTFLVTLGIGCLAMAITSALDAPAKERRLTRKLQQRVDEVELRNTRTLDEL